jgi:carbonic anhydrase
MVSSANPDTEQTIIDGLHDSFSAEYYDVPKGKVSWNGHVSMMDLREFAPYWVDEESEVAPKVSAFESSIGSEHYGAEHRRWEAQQVSFHNPSEHTVDGRRKDMEMHIVHYPEGAEDGEGDAALGNAIFASVIGVLFTSNKDEATELSNAAQAALDTFFQSLKGFDSDVQWSVPLSNLMTILDMDNKWTYLGSFTTPPCTTLVYW